MQHLIMTLKSLTNLKKWKQWLAIVNSSHRIQKEHRLHSHRCLKHNPITYLPLHVHDDNCIWSVTNNKVLRIFRQENHTVHSDVCSSCATQGFEGVTAFCSLHIPNLTNKRERENMQIPYWNETQATPHVSSCRVYNGSNHSILSHNT